MTTNTPTEPVPDPSNQGHQAPELEGTDQPTGDAGLDDDCTSAQIAFTTLTDLGSSLSGLRDLAERKDLLGIGIGDSDIESVERVIVNLVEQLGVGVKLAETSELHEMRIEALRVKAGGIPQHSDDLVDISEIMNFPTPARSKAEGATRNDSDKRG